MRAGEQEGLSSSFPPERLAYDRPSPRLLSFLEKWFGLRKYVKEHNHFVFYDRFFLEMEEGGKEEEKEGERSRGEGRGRETERLSE